MGSLSYLQDSGRWAPRPTFRTLVDGLPVRSVQADRTLQRVHQLLNVPVSTSWPGEGGRGVVLLYGNTYHIEEELYRREGKGRCCCLGNVLECRASYLATRMI